MLLRDLSARAPRCERDPVPGTLRCVLSAILILASGTAGGDERSDDDTDHTHDADYVYEEMVVTADPHSKRRFDVIQGTSVLTGEQLQREVRGTLGETLSRQPGISSSYFGPGASRPVIRGLDGPRIRVLQNGIGTIDASNTSPDHAIASEPMLAERIEVVRGAGTLLYGSSAVGGVVNVLDGRIPDGLPEDGIAASVTALYGSNAREKAAAASIEAGREWFVLKAQGAFRDSEDFEAPGLDDGASRVANSDTRNLGGTLGGSLLWDGGHFGVSYGITDTQYGIPGGHEDSGGGTPPEVVRIDLDQDRVDFGGQATGEWPVFDTARARVAWAGYEHRELEGGEVGTVFRNDGWEGRFELLQRPRGQLHGSAGFQFLLRDFEAIGDEAFVPPSQTQQFGLFAVEEYHWDIFNVEAGLRYEHTHVEALAVASDRSFDNVSFSFGGAWSITDDYLLGLSIARTERPPTAEELYSDGPHLATDGYEIGDPDLDAESAVTVEITARKRHGRLSGGLNVYFTHFDDFIYQLFTDQEIDGLPVRLYDQSTADFYGGELELSFEAIRADWGTGLADFALDYVRARDTESREPLPRIPPLRLRGGLEARSHWVDARLELGWVAAQDRVSAFETPTDDYYLLNALVTWRPIPDRADLSFILEGRNLTDSLARSHVSFLKDEVPLPGRDIRISVRGTF